MTVHRQGYAKGVYRTLETIAAWEWDGGHENLQALAEKLEVPYVDALGANLRAAADKTRTIGIRDIEDSRRRFDAFKAKDSPAQIARLTLDEVKAAIDELEKIEDVYRDISFDLKREGRLPVAAQELLSELLLYVPRLILVSSWLNRRKDLLEQEIFDREWLTLSESEREDRIKRATEVSIEYAKKYPDDISPPPTPSDEEQLLLSRPTSPQ